MDRKTSEVPKAQKPIRIQNVQKHRVFPVQEEGPLLAAFRQGCDSRKCPASRPPPADVFSQQP